MNKEIKGLNGIRAISVLAVLIYHIYPKKITGGFLGVDIFFILSGYLITEILLNEYDKKESISLTNFIIKRIRRLIPACYFMLLSVSIFLKYANLELFIKSKYRIFFSFLYMTNIHNIINKIPYFDNFNNVSPVLHLWSLSVEMQFYIIYIIVLIVITKFFDRKNVKKIIVVMNVLVILFSVFYTRYLYLNTVDYNKIYYSTEIRIVPILIGSVISVFISLDKLKKIKTNLIIELICLSTIIYSFFYVKPLSEIMYVNYGNLFIYCLYIICIIVLANSSIVSNSFMNYIGKISYSIYIWHYPILLLLNIGLLYKIIILFLISIFSYHFIEEPIRVLGVKRFFKNKIKLFVLLSITVLFLFNIFFSNDLVVSQENKENNIENIKVDIEKFEIKKEENVKKYDYTKPKYNKLLCIGDSLAYNIAYAWGKVQPNLVIDAQGGRYFFDAIKIADKYKKFDTDRTAVVIILGTNGPINLYQIEELLKKFKKADLYFLTVNAPVDWSDSVNDVLYEAKEKYPEINIIDWKKTSENREDLFIKDKVHVNKDGAKVMIELIENSFLREFEIDENAKPKYNITTEMRNDMENRLKKEKLKNKKNKQNNEKIN